MLNKELAEILGKAKGIEEFKLLEIGKPALNYMENEAKGTYVNDSNLTQVKDNKEDNSSVYQPLNRLRENSEGRPSGEKRKRKRSLPKNKWIDKDTKSQIPPLDKRTPFLPNQNDLPF